ncbi:MAG: protein-tyrosine phosphatase family protein [Solirubrobacteraceae bacterium]
MSSWFRSYGFAAVYDDLVIGAYPLDADDVRMLAALPVRRVLNLVQESEYHPREREQVVGALKLAGIEERRLDLIDFGHLPAEQLETAVGTVLGWLDRPGASYVHCRAGWQRSAAVAAGAVALREGIGIDDALEYVRQRKPSADPLPHQRDDLRAWWTTRRRAVDGV